MVKGMILALFLLASNSLFAQNAPDSLSTLSQDSVNLKSSVWQFFPIVNLDSMTLINPEQLYEGETDMKDLITLAGKISQVNRDTILDTTGIYELKFKFSIHQSQFYFQRDLLNSEEEKGYDTQSIQVTSDTVAIQAEQILSTDLFSCPNRITLSEIDYNPYSYGGEYLILHNFHIQPGGATFWTRIHTCFYERIKE